MNPDEVVAIGAAVQADILVTGNREMLLLDVTPLSLGIETMGGVVSKIILRNSTIPATGSEMFTSGVDNQTAVDIHVLQGERELVADNRSLARFRLRGIPPMPAGMPRVQVQFQIDANGILSVTASELRTNVEQTIEVKPSYGLTDDQVEQMLIDSFEHAEADFAARHLIEARNEAESVITATEKTLRSPEFPAVAAEELASGERRSASSRRSPVSRRHKSDDREAILHWTNVLNDATRHLAEIMMNRCAASRKNIDSCSGRSVDRIEAGSRSLKPMPNMPKVTFIIDGEPQTVEFEHGKLPYSHHGKPESLLDVAKNLGVKLEHACGGSCACTTCHVIVRQGAQNLSEMEDDEADRLDTAWDLTPHSRLGCQAVIKGDIVCELPMYTRNYVQEGGGIQLGKSDRKKTEEVAR